MSDAPTPDTVPLTLPVPDPFTASWWMACRERRLLVRSCRSCGRLHFPPRPACPSCWSNDVEWHECAGTGLLYSFSIVRENDLAPFTTAVPYVPAVVELTEGPRLMTTIVDSALHALAVDAPVEVVFVDRGEWTFPTFRLARRLVP